MRKLTPLIFVLLVFWIPAVAYAAADDTDAIASLVRMIARGVLDGQYLAAAAVTLSLLTTLARLSWQLDGVGARVLLGVHAFAGSLAAALVAGAGLGWELVRTAVTVGVVAAGGYSLLQPLARWLRPHVERWVPQPLRAVLLTLLRLLDSAPPQQATARPPLVAALLVIGLVFAASCSPTRSALKTGVDTALVCQTDSLGGLAYESYELARAFLVSKISGDGTVDVEGIRAAARQVRTDAGRCAFAAAMAALTDLLQSQRGVMAVGVPPSYSLRSTLATIAAEDWQRAIILDGEDIAL